MTSKTVLRVTARKTDLWPDAEGGWSENGACVRQVVFDMPENSTDFAISRRVLAELDCQGMRRDYWCSADFCWRYKATGVYADVELITISE